MVCFDNEATGMPHISCFATLDDADVAGAALRVRIAAVVSSSPRSLPLAYRNHGRVMDEMKPRAIIPLSGATSVQPMSDALT